MPSEMTVSDMDSFPEGHSNNVAFPMWNCHQEEWNDPDLSWICLLRLCTLAQSSAEEEREGYKSDISDLSHASREKFLKGAAWLDLKTFLGCLFSQTHEWGDLWP